MRRAHRSRELEIFSDRQMLVDSVFLRVMTDITLEGVVVRIKRLYVSEDLPAGGLMLACQLQLLPPIQHAWLNRKKSSATRDRACPEKSEYRQLRANDLYW